MAVGSPTYHQGLSALFPDALCQTIQEHLAKDPAVRIHAVWRPGGKVDAIARQEFHDLGLDPERGVLIYLAWGRKEFCVVLGSKRSLASSAMDRAGEGFRSGKPEEGILALLDSLEGP